MRLIDADALGREVFSHTYSVPILETENKALSEVLHMIHNAPPVEVDKLILIVAKRHGKREMMLNALRPQGKWIVTETFPHKVYGQCSICKQRKRIDNYCPNCGADMRGDSYGQ